MLLCRNKKNMWIPLLSGAVRSFEDTFMFFQTHNNVMVSLGFTKTEKEIMELSVCKRKSIENILL